MVISSQVRSTLKTFLSVSEEKNKIWTKFILLAYFPEKSVFLTTKLRNFTFSNLYIIVRRTFQKNIHNMFNVYLQTLYQNISSFIVLN